jgi:hypothetical protein
MEGEFDPSKFNEIERRERCWQHIEHVRQLLLDDVDVFSGGTFDGDTIEEAIKDAILKEGLDRAVIVAFAFMDDDVAPEHILESIPNGLLLEMKHLLKQYEDRIFLL